MKNLKWEILFFIVFFATRIPYLGQEMFNTDVWKWKQRIYDFGSGVFNLNFEKTLQKYHPGVTLMWIGAAAVKAWGLYCSALTCPNEAVDTLGVVFSLHLFQKIFVVFSLALIFSFIFYPLRELFGPRYAFITLSVLTFEPFFYALTRVIHLEGLMTAFMLASFVWLFYYLETKQSSSPKTNFHRLLLSGMFAGLAALTKSSGLFMMPFGVICISFFCAKSIKSGAKALALWLLTVLLTYFVLWPSMWVQPLKTLDYVFVRGVKEIGIEGSHDQIFMGKKTQNPGILYYPAVAIYKFSPLLVTGILLFFVSIKNAYKNYGKDKVQRFTLLAVIFAFGYLLEITLPTKKLDRYILPTLASLSLLAGFFYTWVAKTLGDKLNIKPIPKKPELAFSALVILASAYQSLSLTPDYFSYYSPFTGGLSKGIYAIEPKWIIGQHQIAAYFADMMQTQKYEPFYQGQSLNNQKDLSQKLIIAFPEKYYTQIWPFIRRTGAWATIEDMAPDAKKSKYFVYPVWDDYSREEKRFKLTYVDSIYLKGVKLYNIYQRHE